MGSSICPPVTAANRRGSTHLQRVAKGEGHPLHPFQRSPCLCPAGCDKRGTRTAAHKCAPAARGQTRRTGSRASSHPSPCSSPPGARSPPPQTGRLRRAQRGQRAGAVRHCSVTAASGSGVLGISLRWGRGRRTKHPRNTAASSQQLSPSTASQNKAQRSKQDCAPDRNIMPGTAGGTVRLSVRAVSQPAVMTFSWGAWAPAAVGKGGMHWGRSELESPWRQPGRPWCAAGKLISLRLWLPAP